MRIFSKQYEYKKQIQLFLIVFMSVGCVFFVWHQLQGEPTLRQEAYEAARPVFEVAVMHPFLARLVQQIGDSFVVVRIVSNPNNEVENIEKICKESRAYIGLRADTDGWIREICGENSDDHVAVFLDAYIKASYNEAVRREVADGYFWLTIDGGKELARAIAKVLSEMDPVHKAQFLDNAYAIGHQLDEVYKNTKDSLYDVRKVKFIGWGDGWRGVLYAYDGSIVRTIDAIYPEQDEQTVLAEVSRVCAQNTRTMVLVDSSFPFETFVQTYPKYARCIVVLDVWGTFSQTWSYAAFVEQNIARIASQL